MNNELAIELVQLGTEWCGPCRMAREYINENFDVDLIHYKYVGIDEIDLLSEKYKHIIEELKPRSIPLFVVLNGDEIIYTFKGFNKTEIEKYADYVVRKSVNQIKDSISQEEMLRLDKMYRDVEEGSADIDAIKDYESSSNGQVYDDDELDIDFEFDEEDEE